MLLEKARKKLSWAVYPSINVMSRLLNSIGDAASGGLLGIGLGAINNAMAVGQQGKFQEMQIKGQKEMMDYQQEKAFDMWNKTNYGAQKEHMKDAGLNPALMYGMGGAGGATTGNPNGSVSAGQASGIMDIKSMAEIDLMKAQAEKLRAEVPNVVKTGTGIDIDNATKEIQKDILAMDKYVEEGIQEMKIQKFRAEMLSAEKDKDIKTSDNDFQNKTFLNRVKQVEADLLETKVEIKLKEMQEKLGASQIKLNDKQIWKIGQEVAAMWKGLDIQFQNMLINGENAETNRGGVNVQRDRLIWDKTIKNVSDSTRLTVETATQLLGDIIRMFGKGGALGNLGNKIPERNPIGFR